MEIRDADGVDGGELAFGGDNTLFGTLRRSIGRDWTDYTDHPFVRALGRGTLSEAAFRYYLGHDYLFLIHFARAYGLAVYKSAHLADMRQAARSLSTILDVEIVLHVDFCRGWGLDEAAMEALPEDFAMMAYTRYVLEAGSSGDLLDLHVALAPFIVGYAEIAARLMADPATVHDGNPYREWIDMYAGADYREVALAQVALLDRLFEVRGGPGRVDHLVKVFGQATRLETAFWQMGLDAAD